jgi:hypothetical protein
LNRPAGPGRIQHEHQHHRNEEQHVDLRHCTSYANRHAVRVLDAALESPAKCTRIGGRGQLPFVERPME